MSNDNGGALNPELRALRSAFNAALQAKDIATACRVARTMGGLVETQTRVKAMGTSDTEADALVQAFNRSAAAALHDFESADVEVDAHGTPIGDEPLRGD